MPAPLDNGKVQMQKSLPPHHFIDSPIGYRYSPKAHRDPVFWAVFSWRCTELRCGAGGTAASADQRRRYEIAHSVQFKILSTKEFGVS